MLGVTWTTVIGSVEIDGDENAVIVTQVWPRRATKRRYGRCDVRVDHTRPIEGARLSLWLTPPSLQQRRR